MRSTRLLRRGPAGCLYRTTLCAET
jgi:hypothetical protein